MGLIKEALDKKNEAKAEANAKANKDEADGEGEGSYSSIFKDIIDTYNYFMNMLKNFKMSSAGLFGNAGDTNDAGQLDREEIKGKSVDNLSYIILSDVFAKDEIRNYFGVSASVDNDKYYNVLLPEERFKNDTDMSLMKGKWKVMNRVENNNERVWRIDCENLDKVIRKDKDGKVIGKDIPAYVSGGDKCSINQKALSAYHTSLIPEKEKVVLSTVGIR